MTDKAILEQLFGDSDCARVLDHLSTFRPFDYSLIELSKILSIAPEKLVKILKHLGDYHFIQITKDKKYKLADNEITKALNVFLYKIMCMFLDNMQKLQQER